MKKHYVSRFLWCLLLLTASTIAPGHAQTSPIVWQRTIENPYTVIAMATTRDGSIGIIPRVAEAAQVFGMTKLNPDGSVAWRRSLTQLGFPSTTDGALSVIEGTQDGGFFLVGSYRQLNISGSTIQALFKIDALGNLVWTRVLTDPQGVSSRNYSTLLSTQDGGCLIGYSVTIGRVRLGAVLIKFNSDGQTQWNKGLDQRDSGGPFIDVSNAIVEVDGGYTVAGTYYLSSLNDGSLPMAVLTRLKSDGQIEWSNTYNSEFAFTDIDYDVQTNGYIVVSNNNQGRGLFMLTIIGSITGRTVISRRAGESLAYVAFAPNPQDGYIVADTDPVNEADFRLTRISRDGSQQSSQTFGGRQADYLQAFDFQPNGTIILAGVTRSIDGDLAARQSISSAPVAWILSVNTNSSTSPVTPPVTPPSGFALTNPVYDCNTGQVTLNTIGGNGSGIEYRIVGNRDWSASNVFTIPAHQRAGTSFTLDARQNGQVVSFRFMAACGTTNPPTTPTPPVGTNLTFGGSSVICDVGQLTINTLGGDGSLIEFKIPGLADWQRSNTFLIPVYQRNGLTFTAYIRQSGREVQTTFTVDCANARVASSPETSQLNAIVSPNPLVGNELVVEVIGAAGQTVDFMLTDLGGRVLTTQQTEVPTNRHQQTMAVGQLTEGIYLLRVSTSTQAKTVKVLKQ